MLILGVIPIIIALLAIALVLALVRKWKAALVLAVMAIALNIATQQIPLNLLHWAHPSSRPAATVSANSATTTASVSRPAATASACSDPSHPTAPADTHRHYNETSASDGQCIRIFEYNVCAKDEYQATHDDSFIDFILSQDADILFLPENLYYHDLKLDTVLSQHYPYSVYAQMKRGWQPEEMGIYSRYPLSDIQRMFTPTNERGSDTMLSAVAHICGREVLLMHLHCYSNSNGLRHAYRKRAEEAQIIADALEANLDSTGRQRPAIVAGDMNDLSGSNLLRTIQKQGLRDVWWTAGHGFGFTFERGWMRFRLDHILVSDEFEPLRVKVHHGQPYSDHRAMSADIRMRP